MISTAVQNFDYGSGSASDEVGSIILDTTAIGKTAGAAVTLTLEADENINLRGPITSSSGALNVVAKAKGVVVENVSEQWGNQITTNGGDIVLWANTENIDSGTGDYTVRVDEGVNLSSGGEYCPCGWAG